MRPGLDIRLEIHVPPSALRAALTAFFVAVPSMDLSSESVTLMTYYPAPSGVYSRIITTGDTQLSRDTGSVAIGSNVSPGTGTRLSVMNGRVGIGTASPSATLDVVGSGGANVDLKVNGRIWTQNGVWVDSAQTQLIGDAGAGNLGLYNNGWSLKVNASGNVGIGIDPSAAKLDVNGTIVARGCSSPVTIAYGGGVASCPANTYATWVTGVMSKYQNGPPSTVLSGSMYCCPCVGTCPIL